MTYDHSEVGRATSGPTLNATSSFTLMELIKDILVEDNRDHEPVTNKRTWDDKATCFHCGVLWPCAVERAFILLDVRLDPPEELRDD